MNISANMLGLDNAATPLGLKAMQHMQELNPKKDTATDAMLMFLVLNASGLVLIPIGIMTYRASCGAANPTDVFVPILIATFVSTLFGIVSLCLKQRIKIFDRVILTWLLGLLAVVVGVVWYFSTLTPEQMQRYRLVCRKHYPFRRDTDVYRRRGEKTHQCLRKLHRRGKGWL